MLLMTFLMSFLASFDGFFGGIFVFFFLRFFDSLQKVSSVMSQQCGSTGGLF